MHKRFVRALLGLSAISIFLFVIRAVSYKSYDFWYLNWNLFLAWLPLIFAYYLEIELKNRRLRLPRVIAYSVMWLGFLPNSFYLVTDFIHLQQSPKGTLLLDVVLLLSFTLSGLALGYASVLVVHERLKKYMTRLNADVIIGLVFLLCSFAIYLGRFLRWNTWDVLINPAGILFDVSDRLLNPLQYEQTFTTTALFFFFISATYLVIREMYLSNRKLKK